MAKIREITFRAEKCEHCKKFIEENNNNTSFFNASFTGSVKIEETIGRKINHVTNVSVKNLIIEKPLGTQIITSQDDVVESEFKNRNESPSDFFLDVKFSININYYNNIREIILQLK